MFYCDPVWHDGRSVDAEYLILPKEDRSVIDVGFATCEKHFMKALKIMLGRNELVRVRKVSSK